MSTNLLNKNIQTAKKLAGIANFVQKNSEAKFLSRGTDVLSTEQEIRDTKKAQVLIPMLTEIKDVATVLAQAKAGGIALEALSINEFIVNLKNEKITAPSIYRPRDGEVLNADELLNRYANSFSLTSTVAKDASFYQNIVAQGTAGVPVAVGGTSLKAEIVDATLAGTDVKEDAFKFANLIRSARNRIKKHKDKFLQTRVSNKDIAIVVNADGETLLGNDARYNMYSEAAVNMNGALELEIDGAFDKSPVLVSKQLPVGIDFVVMMFGSATSLFAIRNKLNMDKIVGVDAYATSLEFDEGTGVWLPHMITIGSSNVTTYPVQPAIGFDAYALPMGVSSTTSGNATGTSPAPKPVKKTTTTK